MKTTSFIAGAYAVLVAAAAPAAAFECDGITCNGPMLDGRQVALPSDPAGTDVVAGGEYNGPALDGRRVRLPDSPPPARR